MKQDSEKHYAVRPALSDDDRGLVQRAIARESDAFRFIIQRYNQRLYRLARSILRNDSGAEDAVQEAYVRAFTHLDSFRGDSSLATWLSRITINEALGRGCLSQGGQRCSRNSVDSIGNQHRTQEPVANRPQDISGPSSARRACRS